MEATLNAMLSRVQAGSLKGFLFMFDDGAGMNHYGLCGSYQEHPKIAYMPACKALYSLCKLIEQRGGI